MNKNNFLGASGLKITEPGVVAWSAPSNIALVKYWGKYPVQIPANPSISFTLDSCRTTTHVFFQPQSYSETLKFEFFFEGKVRKDFNENLKSFFQRIDPYISFLKTCSLRIYSSNSFPHSSGIASSASAFAALALCLAEIEKKLNLEIDDDFFYRKASFLARLGSGSAARSIKGPVTVWGKHPNIKDSSNLYAIEYKLKQHAAFHNFCDTILLVDEGSKAISSRKGHALMKDHIFAENRFAKARENCEALVAILERGDLTGFTHLIEMEALMLHGLMMSSNPPYVLLKPASLSIIAKIQQFRKQTGIMAGFTLDAGANVHLLYPKEDSEKVQNFILQELKRYCQGGKYINDKIGTGARPLQLEGLSEHNLLLLGERNQ